MMVLKSVDVLVDAPDKGGNEGPYPLSGMADAPNENAWARIVSLSVEGSHSKFSLIAGL